MRSSSSNKWMPWVAIGVLVCLLLCSGLFGMLAYGVAKGVRQARVQLAEARKSVAPPAGQLVLCQTLDFSDGEQTMQGSSFLARTPGGSVVIVTAAHFLDFEGPALERLSVFGEGPVAASIVAFGPPGDAGIDTASRIDLRADSFLLVPESEPVGAVVLEMDERPRASLGEKVWMPDAIGAMVEPPGELLTAVVREIDNGYVLIIFDTGQYVELMGASGAPVISQRTGKVIGLISRGGTLDGQVVALLTPASGILRAMREAERTGVRPRLRDCVGKEIEQHSSDPP